MTWKQKNHPLVLMRFLFNRFMNETFDVCENNDKDIYAIGFDNLMNEFELFQISV